MSDRELAEILELVEAEKRRTSYNPKLIAAVERLVADNADLQGRVAKLEEKEK